MCVSVNMCIQVFGTFLRPPPPLPGAISTLFTEGKQSQSRAAGPGEEVGMPKSGAREI